MINLVRICLIAACIGVYFVQSAIDRGVGLYHPAQDVLFLPSGQVIKKLSLGYNGLLADIYWMRAVQYYGGKRLKNEPEFRLLEPLISIATTLDPQLLHAYRFGAVFLSEREPIGAGQPERAIALLQKGIEHNPDEWQLHRDVGFIYYWFLNNYKKAAESFLEGSRNPKSAVWMKTFAAQLLAQGGSREAARFLWQEVYQTSENQRMKDNAREHLQKLTVEEDIEMLQFLIKKVESRTGRKIGSIDQLVHLGFFKAPPSDPKGFRYMLDPKSGQVGLSPGSTIRRY
jgi:tetratricopeptide (TPR) repeat protein